MQESKILNNNTEISEEYFIKKLIKTSKNHFSIQGAYRIYEYLIYLVEEVVCEPMEIDFIDICREYTEYKSKSQMLSDYSAWDIEAFHDYVYYFKTEKGSYVAYL